MVIIMPSTPTPSAASLPVHLAEAGFILTPDKNHIAAIKAAGLQLTSQEPLVVSAIPNRKEFGTGADIGGAMYIIKTENSDQCTFPARDKPFLATLQDMIDHEYALGDAHKLVFAIRPSRHTAAAGEAHQSHITGWHTHTSYGQHRIQTAADQLSTKFQRAGKEISAPNGSVIMFDEQTLHCTPTAKKATRRTFLAFMALTPHIAYRALRHQEHVNPAERLLCQQPYRSYNENLLNQHWTQRGTTEVARQRAGSIKNALNLA